MKFFLPVFCLFLVFILIMPNTAKSQYANYLVISEVVYGNVDSDDEFIEIYNPTNQAINLDSLNLKLHIRSSTSSDSNKNINWIKHTIPAYGYFLFVSSASTTYLSQADATYSSSNGLVSNGAVYISTNSNPLLNVIDFIAWGNNPVPAGYENQLTDSFSSGKSIERKSDSNSILANKGNAWDTNTNDFLVINTPNPQNSSSNIEFCPQNLNDQVNVLAIVEPVLQFKLLSLSDANFGSMPINTAINKAVAKTEIGTNAMLGSFVLLQASALQGINTNYIIDHTENNPQEIFKVSATVNNDGLGIASTNYLLNNNDTEIVSGAKTIYENNGAENFDENNYDLELWLKLKADNTTPADQYFTVLTFTVSANF